ncbi:ATP-binding protein [Rhodococcus aetherivorans]
MVSFDDVRIALADRFRVVTAALSADGREVLLTGPVDVGVDVGGFAVVELDDGRRLAVQVRSVRIVEREGADVDVTVDEPGLPVRSVRGRAMVRTLAGSATVLGVFGDGRFVATPETEPFPERHVRPATEAETATIAAALAGTLDVGTMLHAPAVPARLHPAGFARHTFMCGQSGSGKTYTTGAVLERLLVATTLPIVVLDPNSDHVQLGRLRDPGTTPRRAPASRGRDRSAGGTGPRRRLRPPAVPGSQRPSPRRAGAAAAPGPGARPRRVLGVAPRHRLPRRPLLGRGRAVRGGGRPRDRASRDPHRQPGDRGVGAVAPGDERSAAELDMTAGRCFVIDLGSLNSPGERAAVALGLLGRLWMLRRRRLPMLLVVDEAHNILPSATADPLSSSTADLGVLIAGEGRKFGLHLFVATQRPGKVHPNVVSQCDNLLLMRMNGSTDRGARTPVLARPAGDAAPRHDVRAGPGPLRGTDRSDPLLARVGTRVSPEGGADVPTDWAHPAADTGVLTYPHEGPESS